MSGADGPDRTYDRSWEEIEEMLELAEERAAEWRAWFEECKNDGDRDGICLLYTSPSPRDRG